RSATARRRHDEAPNVRMPVMRYATAVAVLFLVASVGNARAASSARATTGTPAGRGVVAGASGPGPSHVARGRAAARRTARPAASEHAKLVYRLHGHRADGRSAVLETTVEATPGASTEYESKFLDVDGGKVEYVIVPALGGAVAPPGVLMIHGHGNHARHMIRMARQLAARGFT